MSVYEQKMLVMDFKPDGGHMLECMAWRFEPYVPNSICHRTSMRPDSVQKRKAPERAVLTNNTPRSVILGDECEVSKPCFSLAQIRMRDQFWTGQ
jgi:hypothetical protein